MEVNHYSPVTYDEQVSLLIEMFKHYEVDFDESEVKDFVACTDFKLIETYLDDIGIVITSNELGVYASTRSINDDVKWVARKVNMFWRHFAND